MNKTTRHVFVWGWLRLVLGLAQTSLVVASLWSLLNVGLRPTTWILVAASTITALTSRLIYRGRS